MKKHLETEIYAGQEQPIIDKHGNHQIDQLILYFYETKIK
jgi:hypothetical protein